MSENVKEIHKCDICESDFDDIHQLINHVNLNHSPLGVLLKNMGIPEFRRNDLQWIKRNLPFNNSQHPDFEQAWKLLGMMNNE